MLPGYPAGVAATSPPYPTPGWATTQVYPARREADGHEDDVDQRMFSGPLHSRVLKVLEVSLKRSRSVTGHEPLRNQKTRKSPQSRRAQ